MAFFSRCAAHLQIHLVYVSDHSSSSKRLSLFAHQTSSSSLASALDIVLGRRLFPICRRSWQSVSAYRPVGDSALPSVKNTAGHFWKVSAELSRTMARSLQPTFQWLLWRILELARKSWLYFCQEERWILLLIVLTFYLFSHGFLLPVRYRSRMFPDSFCSLLSQIQ